MSALLTCVSFFSLRMRPGAFVPRICRLPECERIILPVAVTLNRFAAPRCVFNFNFGLEAFLGIAKSSLHTATPCLGSESRKPDRFRFALRSLLRRLLRWFCRCRSALFRRQQRDQYVAFHARHRFDLSVLGDF